MAEGLMGSAIEWNWRVVYYSC